MDRLAQNDDADEDQADDQHRADDAQAFLGGGLRGEHHGAILLDAQSVPVECDPCLGAQLPCGAGGLAEPQRGSCRGPLLAVARKPVGARLGAARDERGEVGHGLDRPGLGDAHEAVRVEVVAEQQGGVVVARREQPRRPVVEEVALVDRLEPQCVPLLGERREDGLQLAFRLRAQGIAPEAALARRLRRDRLPETRGYDQVASSFVQ